MRMSSFDKLRSRVGAALREYAASDPHQRISIIVDVTKLASDNHTVTVSRSEFVGGNVLIEDTKRMIEDARHSDEPAAEILHDIDALANTGNQKDAIELAEQLVRIYALNPLAHQWLGLAYGPEKGVSNLLEALRLAETKEWLSRYDRTVEIDIRLRLGDFYFLLNEDEAGLEQFNIALERAQQAGIDTMAKLISSLIADRIDKR